MLFSTAGPPGGGFFLLRAPGDSDQRVWPHLRAQSHSVGGGRKTKAGFGGVAFLPGGGLSL